jgi:predicted metal-dependent hydrolase
MSVSSTVVPRERITIRRMDFAFGPDIPENWADDNALLTAVLAGLSAAFPPGERYFIESVRQFGDRVKDPELKERIRGFMGQEANHAREHVAFNEFLDGRGLPVTRMQEFVERALRRLVKRDSPARNLARTAALEHMTAFLASALLENPALLERMHPTVATFWAWHAIEEIEHRSVAFEVYKAHVGDERLRVRTMAVVTLLFALATAVRTVVLMQRTGNLFNVPAWARGLDVMFGRHGILRKGLPLYRAYYDRGFHPDNHDNRDAVARARSAYLRAPRMTAPTP